MQVWSSYSTRLTSTSSPPTEWVSFDLFLFGRLGCLGRPGSRFWLCLCLCHCVTDVDRTQTWWMATTSRSSSPLKCTETDDAVPELSSSTPPTPNTTRRRAARSARCSRSLPSPSFTRTTSKRSLSSSMSSFRLLKSPVSWPSVQSAFHAQTESFGSRMWCCCCDLMMQTNRYQGLWDRHRVRGSQELRANSSCWQNAQQAGTSDQLSIQDQGSRVYDDQAGQVHILLWSSQYQSFDRLRRWQTSSRQRWPDESESVRSREHHLAERWDRHSEDQRRGHQQSGHKWVKKKLSRILRIRSWIAFAPRFVQWSLDDPNLHFEAQTRRL